MPLNLVTYLSQLKAAQTESLLFIGRTPNYVCCWEDGMYLHPDYVTHQFAKLAATMGLGGLRFHDLRHTHATLLLASGESLRTISDRLGHSSVSITGDLYAHVISQTQIAAADRFDQLFQNGPSRISR